MKFDSGYFEHFTNRTKTFNCVWCSNIVVYALGWAIILHLFNVYLLLLVNLKKSLLPKYSSSGKNTYINLDCLVLKVSEILALCNLCNFPTEHTPCWSIRLAAVQETLNIRLFPKLVNLIFVFVILADLKIAIFNQIDIIVAWVLLNDHLSFFKRDWVKWR